MSDTIEREILLAANEMITRYGSEASQRAAIGIAAALSENDEEGAALCKRVLVAIDQLASIGPGSLMN